MTRAFQGAAALVLVAAAAAPVGASAQLAGSLLARVGVTQIRPDVSSGNLTAPTLFAGSQIDMKSATQPTAGLTYMVTDNIALDLPLSAGFKHDIVGAGAIGGVGRIGEVKLLPISLMAQWRLFDAQAPLRPYLGIGPTYAKFYKARSTAALTALTGGTPASPTTIEVDSKWALTVQAGASYRVSPRWFIDATVHKTALRTRMRLSSGQSLDADPDPWMLSVGFGYRF